MGDSKPSSSDISNSETAFDPSDILDQIIRIKRQGKKLDKHRSITDSEREELLMAYWKLEELRNSLEGRVLLEYQDGLRTVTEELIL